MKKCLVALGMMGLLGAHALVAQAASSYEDEIVALQATRLHPTENQAVRAPADDTVKDLTLSFVGKCLPGATPRENDFSILFTQGSATVGKVTASGADGSQCTMLSWVTDAVKRPLVSIVEGYPACADANLAAVKDFVYDKVLLRTQGNWRIDGVDTALDATAVKVSNAFSGKTYCAPFARFWVVFIDDKPSQNWSHACRYVFVKDDLSAFVTWYENAPLVVRDGEGELRFLQWRASESALNGAFVNQHDVMAEARQALNALNAIASEILYTGDTSKSYALLISGGCNKSSNYSRYWGDVAMFYNTLRKKYAMPKDHIKVYVSDGLSTGADMNLSGSYQDSPWDLDNDGNSDVTGSATKSNLKSAIASLAGSLTADDQFFVFITDHGYQDSDTGTAYLVPWLSLTGTLSSTSQMISPTELSSWFSSVKSPVAFAFEFCYSGAFIAKLKAQSNRVIATACGANEPSSAFVFSDPDDEDYGVSKTYAANAFKWCNPWAFAFNSAIRGLDSVWTAPWNDDSSQRLIPTADSNGDKLVSMKEAAAAAEKFILNTTYKYSATKTLTFCDTPQYGVSSSGLGEKFFVLKQSAPATYTITYRPGSSGSGSVQTQTKTAGSSVTLKGAVFTRSGYAQTGWSKTDGGSQAYSLSATYSTDASITLYPVWTVQKAAYDFSFPTATVLASTKFSSWTKPLILQSTQPSGYSYSPLTSYASGTSPYVHYIINNAGSSVITNIYVSYVLYDSSGTQVASTRRSASNLTAGYLHALYCQWDALKTLSAGTYTLKLTLDPDSLIPETTRSDNTASYGFTVTSSGGDGGSTSLSIPAAGGGDSAGFAFSAAGTYVFDGSSKPSWITSLALTVLCNGSSFTIGTGKTTLSLNASSSVGIAMSASANTTGSARTWTYPITMPDGKIFKVYVSQSAQTAAKSLSSIAISGSASVSSGATSQYVCKATYSDGSAKTVSPTWSISSGSSYATISSSGLLTASTLATARTVTIKATYSESGVTKAIEYAVSILANGSSVQPQWSPVTKSDTFILYARVYDSGKGKYLEATDGILGVFSASGECRGRAEIITAAAYRQFIVTVGIDSSSETGLVVKYYSSETGIVTLGTTLDAGAEQIGEISSPKVLVTNSALEITLSQGWNWISANLTPSDGSFATLFAGCDFQDNDMVKSGSGSATYYAGTWYPSPSTFKLEAGKAYMVKKSSSGSATVKISGAAASARIAVSSGWNWIGSTAASSVLVGSGLAHSVGFKDNDLINSRNDSATYYGGTWYSSGLTKLVPGVGYKARFTNAGYLQFGSSANEVAFLDANECNEADVADATSSVRSNDSKNAMPDWQGVVLSDTIVGYFTVKQGTRAIDAQGSTLAVFSSSGECRGMASVVDGPGGRKIYMLTIAVNNGSEKNFTLKVWDAEKDKVYTVDSLLDPAGADQIGQIANPMELTVPDEEEDPDPVDPDPVDPDPVDPDPVDPDPVGSAYISFEDSFFEVSSGDTLCLVVTGGSDEQPVSVQVKAHYLNAKASNLDLANARVLGDDDAVEAYGLKFPLTLKWKKGDLSSKTIEIPVKVGKATDAPKYLGFQLQNASGMELGDYALTYVAIVGEVYAEDVYVHALSDDATLGTASGGGLSVYSEQQGTYKSVALKATPAKGYWFAGWYDACGQLVGVSQSAKVSPDCTPYVMTCFAKFVKADASFAGTYNGYARVNLENMSIVKNVDVDDCVYGEYAATVTISTAGKVSGSISVGGKRATIKGESCLEIQEDGTAVFGISVDEKVWFGNANTEILMLYVSPGGYAFFEPCYAYHGDAGLPVVASDDSMSWLYKDMSKVATEVSKYANFAGTYTGAVETEQDGVIPFSMVVDKKGKAKVTGYFLDGTSFSASGQFGGYEKVEWEDTCEQVALELCFAPKVLGGGSCHFTIYLYRTYDAETRAYDVSAGVVCSVTYYTATRVMEVIGQESSSGYAIPYTAGCWIPEDVDPDFGVLSLVSNGLVDEEKINVLMASKNGKITGLGKAVESGVTVKFDNKTGLLSVKNGKAYSLVGYLGADGMMAFGRVDADGVSSTASGMFSELEMPEEIFPWGDEGVELVVGDEYEEYVAVLADGNPLTIAVSGLPSALKYDKTQSVISGTVKRAGTFVVKISYSFAGKKVTRQLSFVVRK